MNKRINKKINKRINNLLQYNPYFAYANKCRYCQNHEDDDFSVGLTGGCYVFDDWHQVEKTTCGFTCKNFKPIKKTNPKLYSIPKTYKEIKKEYKSKLRRHNSSQKESLLCMINQ